MPFLIVSRTSGVFFVEKELSHLSLWQANNAISPKEMFSMKSTQFISLKANKKLYAASLWTY